jgi:hypothetical protein
VDQGIVEIGDLDSLHLSSGHPREPDFVQGFESAVDTVRQLDEDRAPVGILPARTDEEPAG